MNAPAQTPYDEVRYPSYTHVQTHPDRLATIATMFGMTPAPVERCRVLELGCGDGSNLIPMACVLPESEFVGIDLAAQPVAEGQQMIADLALRNIRLVHGNVAEIGPEWGRFDYIIAHGLYSWVPAEVREQLLAIVCASLASQGVAFVSYNAYPGQHLGQMVREMMLFHVRALAPPQERIQQAQALVRFLAEAETGPDEFRQFMKAELQTVRDHEPGHLFHDELAPISAPLYFTQFMEHAHRHSLQYLGEADYFEALDWAFSPAVREALRQIGPNRILREQYMDFLKCRRFRQTLLCHRDVRLQTEPQPEQVPAFLVSSPARPVASKLELSPGLTGRFETPKGAKIETDFALGKAALSVLADIWPRPLPFEELLAQARVRLRAAGVLEEASAETRLACCRFLLQNYGAGAVAFHRFAPACATSAGERPCASALARLQLQRGADFVASAYHHIVKLEDEIGRQLLLLLDGTRDRAVLIEELLRFLKSREALAGPDWDEADTRQTLTSELEKNLAKLARLGLLVE